MKYVHRELKTTLSILCNNQAEAAFARALSTEDFVDLAGGQGGRSLNDYSFEEVRQFEEEVVDG